MALQRSHFRKTAIWREQALRQATKDQNIKHENKTHRVIDFRFRLLDGSDGVCGSHYTGRRDCFGAYV